MGYPSEQQGALIAQVNRDSTAQEAGVKVGDIITKINNTPITQASQVKATVSLLRAGSKANLHILRDGKDKDISVLVTDVKGVMVVGALESSAGFRAGLRPGDVIISANRKGISQMDELQMIAKSTPKKLLLQVLRNDGALFVVVE